MEHKCRKCGCELECIDSWPIDPTVMNDYLALYQCPHCKTIVMERY